MMAFGTQNGGLPPLHRDRRREALDPRHPFLWRRWLLSGGSLEGRQGAGSEEEVGGGGAARVSPPRSPRGGDARKGAKFMFSRTTIVARDSTPSTDIIVGWWHEGPLTTRISISVQRRVYLWVEEP
jgi:hypothetical protein